MTFSLFSSLLFLLSTFSTLSHSLAPHSHHQPHSATHNYRDALTKSIIFFEGQRSGKLPSNQRMSWRRDSALSDGSAMNVWYYLSPNFFSSLACEPCLFRVKCAMQVDLVGGYYDAGDNVKFGFPMAFTTTMLSWSVIEFGGVMKGELQNAREAIRWGTDYLLKATAHPDTIYVQVTLLFIIFSFICQLLPCYAKMLMNTEKAREVWLMGVFFFFFRWEMLRRTTLVGRGLRTWTPQEVFSK